MDKRKKVKYLVYILYINTMAFIIKYRRNATIIVLIPTTGYMTVNGINDYFFSTTFPYFQCPQQAHQQVMVTYLLDIISLLGLGFCFWFTICLGRHSNNDFSLVFTTIIFLTPQFKKLIFEYCQLLRIKNSNFAF